MEILKNRPLIFLIICVVFLASCKFGNQQVEVITSDEMESLLLSESIQLVDVRSFEEFQEKHIKGAQSIVFDSEFKENISRLDKSKPVAVYCRTGRRSKECSQILMEQGFTKIYDLEGGLEKWEHENFIVSDK
jgi:rhodanese-related sulfurtransferase